MRICVYLWTHTPHSSREHEDNVCENVVSLQNHANLSVLGLVY